MVHCNLVRICQIIGQSFVFSLAKGYRQVQKEIKRIEMTMKDYGLQLLYRNHDFGFMTPPDGSCGLDGIYSNVPAVRAPFRGMFAHSWLVTNPLLRKSRVQQTAQACHEDHRFAPLVPRDGSAFIR